MKEIIYDLIKRMEEEKVAQKVSPVIITGMDLTQVIKVSLRQLVDEGRLHASVTIGDYYVKTTAPKEDTQDPGQE